MNFAIILAAGNGRRFQGDKTLVLLQGKPVVVHSLERFQAHPQIDGIILVGNEKNLDAFQEFPARFSKIKKIVKGGASRFESARIGFETAQQYQADLLIFHNGANPGVSDREIGEVITKATESGAAGVARPVRSTLRKSRGGVVAREGIYEMETPQAVKAEIFAAGLANVEGEPTDDLQVAEFAGLHPELVHAEPINRKLTFPDDLTLFEASLLSGFSLRIGIGQDSHPFADTGKLILGGIRVPDTPKLSANSDGDVVLHALTNAISSALGGGSLSGFADPLCKQGITDSSVYLNEVLKRLKSAGGSIVNISLSLEAGEPKLEPHFSAMRTKLSELLDIEAERVGITITSGENLTAFGKGKGIFVIAQVLLKVSEHDR